MRTSLDVHTHLLDREIPHEICPVRPPLEAPEQACGILGLELDELIRVTVFATPAGPVVALTTFDCEPDADAVAYAAGVDRAERASLEASSRCTGYPARWAPPVAHQQVAMILIDPALLKREILYSLSGEPGAVLKLRSEDLAPVTGGILAELSSAPALYS